MKNILFLIFEAYFPFLIFVSIFSLKPHKIKFFLDSHPIPSHLSVNWIYRTDEEYFLLKFFENNHKCVPFGLFITKINILLLLNFYNFCSGKKIVPL
jgi:hypothetical protein